MLQQTNDWQIAEMIRRLAGWCENSLVHYEQLGLEPLGRAYRVDVAYGSHCVLRYSITARRSLGLRPPAGNSCPPLPLPARLVSK